MARLLIGVTGSVAAYKAIETARLAIAGGLSVRVVQTETATRFVGAASLAAITGAPVLIGEFDEDPMRGAYPGEPPAPHAPISHLALAQRADAYLIAPASASTIAKLAAGLADSMVTTAALAVGDIPVLVAPAMNDRMYRHPATQRNLDRLRSRGVILVGPADGALASLGEHGTGRMSEPAELVEAVRAALAARAGGADGPSGGGGSVADAAWLGRRVLVTAGGTREPIDSVRFIGNRSSGRMGYALAARALARGAEVTIVAANVALDPPAGATVVPVATAADLEAACAGAFERCDVLLMAAAVADFRPRAVAERKLRKADGPPRVELEPTVDVLAALAARRRPGQLIVGFAAEDGPDPVGSARSKLARKGLDAVVLNDVSEPGIGFDTPDNEVTVVVADGTETTLARAGKEQIADGVLDRVRELLGTDREEHDGHRAAADRAARV